MTVEGVAANSAFPGGPPRLAAGSVLGGRFTIAEFLGHGPFAELFQATDGSDGKSVVVKLLHRELVRDSSARARLEHELAIAVQLDHKNICQTYGFWFESGESYLAVESVDGTTVREMIDKKHGTAKGFSLKGAYNVIAHVCNALAYANGSLVHGALTPSSILVNSAGRVKLTDFGIARALPAVDRIRAQFGLGILAAIAPEMASSPDRIDRRADVYSVGAILFELLTGRPVSAPFETPSRSVPGLPPALDPILERCLRSDPAERYADAQTLKHALHGALEFTVAGTPSAVSSVSAATPPATRPPALPATAAAGGKPPAPPAAAARSSASKPIAKAPIAATFNIDTALSGVDESQERWLIQKDKLDFGPFRLAEVKHQIEKGQIKGDHTIVDMENGERKRVREHSLLRDFVLQIEGKFEDRSRAAADAAESRRHKRNQLTLLAVMAGIVVIGGGGAIVWVLTRPPVQTTKIVYKERDQEDLLKGIEISMKVDPPVVKPKRPRHQTKAGQKNANGEFSDVTNLGDASDESGGDETLSQEVVQHTMSMNFNVLKGCVLDEKRRTPSLKNIDMDFVIKGDGLVSAVKVNGDAQSTFATCMYNKMRAVNFPKFNGSKTHASFSLALK